jgi:hypothetical protein
MAEYTRGSHRVHDIKYHIVMDNKISLRSTDEEDSGAVQGTPDTGM